MQKTSSRFTAAKILLEIFNKKVSLNTALKNNLKTAQPRDQAFIQELCYGVMRWHWQLAAIAELLLTKPLKTKDMDIYLLLLLGFYQLIHLQTPAHAAINETVAATRIFKKPWASGLLNATLRKYQREQIDILDKISSNLSACYSHPDWLIQIIKTAWPINWENILNANNQYPPLTLRVNSRKLTRETYLTKLTSSIPSEKIPQGFLTHYSSYGITLSEACDIKKLPGFITGEFSVQDESAQLAADLLELKPQQYVLDACAAPGGKTAHILELEPNLKALFAIDVDKSRLEKITENIHRLQLNQYFLKPSKTDIHLICADAAKPDTWWQGNLFDRILLDAPCSATGVIRRHPDIKFLRRAEDIAQLAQQQLDLLNALWPLLKINGLLIYATCSVLPQENEMVLEKFLAAHTDAKEKLITAEWGIAKTVGRQLLPQQQAHDGFYYAALEKI